MRLRKIRLINFRTFYGDQSLDISAEDDRNVTLVHAENGVGKTTLLNAILWTFFNQVTGKFEQKENIVNFEAEREGKRTATVEVDFEHEKTEYVASRTQGSNGKRLERKFEVYKLTNGARQVLPAPDSFINSVIPKDMAPYFFFDGEQAETFAAEGNTKEIRGAIQDILGSNLIMNAIEDLEYCEKVFRREVTAVDGGIEAADLEKQIEEAEASIEKLTTQINQLRLEKSSIQELVDKIVESLRGAERVAEIQRQRDEKNRRINNLNEDITQTQAEIVRWVGTQSFALVAVKLTQTTLNFIDEASLKGRIPSPYNEEFVKGLLSSGECICHRPLSPASAEWNAVAELLRDAAKAEILGRVVRASTRIGLLKESIDRSPRDLEKLEKKNADLISERRELEQSLGELGKQFENAPFPDIREKERARKNAEEKLGHINHEIGDKERLKIQKESEVKQLKDQQELNAARNKVARKLLNRVALAERGHELLRKLQDQYEERARGEIEAIVNRILEKTARKSYTCEITRDFVMRLLFSDGTHAPKSSGENQMLSLAFIAALIKFAESRSAVKDSRIFIPGTVAPLVLDSPFGQLDNLYREATAAFVPSLASQVILLLSSSQGKDEVITALHGKIGREYVLISENRGPRGDKKEEHIIVNGTRIQTTLFNCERNLTRIERVK